MAKSDLPTDEGGNSRVFKSSQVHKRRIDSEQRAALRKARESAQQTADDSADEPARPKREGRTHFTDMPVAEFADEAPANGLHSDREFEQTESGKSTVKGDVVSDNPPAVDAEQAVAQKPAARFTVIHGAKPASADTSDAAPAAPDEAAPDSANPSDGTAATAPSDGTKPLAQSDRPSGFTRPRVRRRADGERAEGESAERASAKKRKPLSHSVRVALGVVGGVLAVLLILFGVFSWNRWLRFDDRADFQGTWYADGTAIAITVDDQVINFTKDVSYAYEIDPGAKTIEYKFGPMSGQGRYWFTDDRQKLVIIDGAYSGIDTFVQDVERALYDFSRLSGNSDIIMPSGDGIIVLNREAATAMPTAVAPTEPLSGTSADNQPSEGQAASDDASADEGAQADAASAADVAEQSAGDAAVSDQGDEA